MRISRLQVNHMDQPLGIHTEGVRLSYVVEETGAVFQSQSRIQLSTAPEQAGCVYDTGIVDTVQDPETGKVLQGIDNLCWTVPVRLEPRTRYYWRVWVRTDSQDSAWSDWAWFETAKAVGETWQAIPITTPFGQDVHPVFRKRFPVSAPVRQARLYCIGLGEYEAALNAVKLGDEVLQPGFHSYDSHLQYQTYELPVAQGENEIVFSLGDGWYKGRYGLKRGAPRYGDAYVLLAEIHLQYMDGKEEVFGTDETWETGRSQIVFDGIYDGETVDARIKEWAEIKPAIRGSLNQTLLVPRFNPRLRVQQQLAATPVPGHPNLFDFEQNMVGWIEFLCDAPAGTVVTVKFGELIQDDALYRENLRSAACTFTYISDGQKRLVRPHFTFFGFRYAQFEGWTPAAEDLHGCVIHSDMRQIGRIHTSHPKVNRLVENVLWGQKGNFLDVPTDCPQRDERMGWTGDIQIFSDTACFNMDCTAFLEKYMNDLLADQKKLGGSVPCVSPMTHYPLGGVAAWGDAVTVVPWQVYLHSGDAAILKKSFDGMKAWVDWIRRQTEIDHTGYLWSASQQLGDWLALDEQNVYGATDRALISTAYYYLSARITAQTAAVLGDGQAEAEYASLAGHIRNAFQQEFFTPTGRMTAETQTACAVATHLGLAPNERAQKRLDALLRKRVLEAGVRLDTGFVGTPWLLPALTEGGNAELAYRLLLREEYPGWLYEVNNGATTIWERWNCIEPDGVMRKNSMNSLNHYAYGSVAAWMYRTIGGLSPAQDAPGFRHILCRPVPDRCLEWARVELDTGNGCCQVGWQWQGNTLELRVRVPFGCVMSLTLPGSGELQTLHAGEYTWRQSMPEPSPSGLDEDWRVLLAHPETRAIIEELFPKAIRGVPSQEEMYTLRQLSESPFSNLNRDQIKEVERRIRNVQMKMNHN